MEKENKMNDAERLEKAVDNIQLVLSENQLFLDRKEIRELITEGEVAAREVEEAVNKHINFFQDKTVVTELATKNINILTVSNCIQNFMSVKETFGSCLYSLTMLKCMIKAGPKIQVLKKDIIT